MIHALIAVRNLVAFLEIETEQTRNPVIANLLEQAKELGRRIEVSVRPGRCKPLDVTSENNHS